MMSIIGLIQTGRNIWRIDSLVDVRLSQSLKGILPFDLQSAATCPTPDQCSWTLGPMRESLNTDQVIRTTGEEKESER